MEKGLKRDKSGVGRLVRKLLPSSREREVRELDQEVGSGDRKYGTDSRALDNIDSIDLVVG